jgi:hypothetical protein
LPNERANIPSAGLKAGRVLEMIYIDSTCKVGEEEEIRKPAHLFSGIVYGACSN